MAPANIAFKNTFFPPYLQFACNVTFTSLLEHQYFNGALVLKASERAQWILRTPTTQTLFPHVRRGECYMKEEKVRKNCPAGPTIEPVTTSHECVFSLCDPLT